MNEHALLHIPDSNYCFPVGKKEVVIRFRTAKEDKFKEIAILYGNKYDFSFAEKRKKATMRKEYTDRLYDYYTVRLHLEDVRLAYVFLLDSVEKIWYYSEDGLSDTYNFILGYYNFYQLPYINDADIHKEVPWMRDAVFYEIFVDRFFTGTSSKNKDYINLVWGEIPNQYSFAGGDLYGICEKLDYIKELGCNAIYLTPIFQSISNHKYDVNDYQKIDEQFGGETAFRRLMEEAHRKEVRIVLDIVFNHCSDQLMQFQDVLEKGRHSIYYDWFLINGDYIDTKNVNYECFAACNYMPKLNTSNTQVQQFLIDNVAYYTTEFDIDGWRLDVSDEVSHDFWRSFRKAVKAVKEDCVIIGENWHDASVYLKGDQYDGIMNYAFTKACLDYFATGNLDARGSCEKLNGLLMRNTDTANEMMLNLLDSHDTHRFLTQLQGDKKKMLAALAVLMFFPGAPCIYYGTEIAMEGGYDPDCRRTFDWEEDRWDHEFFTQVEHLVTMRKAELISYGYSKIHEINEMLVIERKLDGEEGKMSLYVNMTMKEKILPSSEIIQSNLEENGTLKPMGFAIIKEQ